MADRYSKGDVQRVFDGLIDRMREMGMDTERAYLQSQGGLGVGGTLFTVGNLPGGIGTFSTVGARNAYDALMFAGSVLYAAQKHMEGRS